MKQRRLPFGYEMVQGKAIEAHAEAELVRWMFRSHSEGASYDSLTAALRLQETPYTEGKQWNKNMVARILADRRYLGNEVFPPLIESALLEAVMTNVTQKTPQRKKSELAATMQRLAICSVCGAKVYRASHQHGKERWYCEACKMISTKATDKKLELETVTLISMLMSDPDRVAFNPQDSDSGHSDLHLHEKTLEDALNADSFDEPLARKCAISLAAARIEDIGDEDYETMRIRHVLSKTSSSTEHNALLRDIASALLIHPDGEVSLMLKNGQIIEKE